MYCIDVCICTSQSYEIVQWNVNIMRRYSPALPHTAHVQTVAVS